MSRHLLSRHLRRNFATVPSTSTPTRYVYDMAVALMTADFFARMWFKAKDKWAIYKAKDASVRAVGRT